MTEQNLPHALFCNMGLLTTDRLWIHPERTAATIELICPLSGEVVLTDGGREATAKPGQLLLL